VSAVILLLRSAWLQALDEETKKTDQDVIDQREKLGRALAGST